MSPRRPRKRPATVSRPAVRRVVNQSGRTMQQAHAAARARRLQLLKLRQGRRPVGVVRLGAMPAAARLTVAQDEEMTRQQNTAIAARRRELGRELTNTEKLDIIGRVQREYIASKGGRGGYVGPGTQTSYDPGNSRGITFPLDSVLSDRPQTPVAIAPLTFTYAKQEAADRVAGVASILTSPVTLGLIALAVFAFSYAKGRG